MSDKLYKVWTGDVVSNKNTEYVEALSRLEAPERPPRIRYIKRIPFGNYPDHFSTKDWNRVLKEGRYSKLPKYSISQRVCITNNDLGQYVYDFPLDTTFTTAVGDRKCIAVRRINFNSTYKETPMNLELSLPAFKDHYYIEDGEEKQFSDNRSGDYNQSKYIYSFRQFLETITDMLINRYKYAFPSIEDLIEEYSFNEDTSKITIKLNHITKSNNLVHPFSFNFFVSCPNNDLFRIFSDDNSKLITATITSTDSAPFKSTLVYDLSPIIRIKTFIPQSVCSTINPYSVQNIIGSLQETHDELNKMYPYDRQNTFSLWFNDMNGNRILNEYITGYMDLELIVDNSNNFNLDA